MLVLNGESGEIADRGFADFIDLLKPEDLLVFNDTRVMPARLFGRKESGGKVELLLERILEPGKALVKLKSSKSPKPGGKLNIGGHCLVVQGREGDLFIVETSAIDFQELMEREGHMPLPPYIRREDKSFDETRYQTVYADRPGAVAAPTAGLHFDEKFLQQIALRGVRSARVTLHVGAGTFQPVRVERIEEHRMHSEWLEVDEVLCRQVATTRELGGRVIAVGTTSVRSLETAAASGKLAPYQGDTRLFITPGYRFRVVDAMLTNFHLPESTLLMLVSAFGGYEQVMAAYRHAVEQAYRFFSYGDAMFISSRNPQQQV